MVWASLSYTSLSLHVLELGMNHSLMYLEFVFPMPDLEHRLDLVSILELQNLTGFTTLYYWMLNTYTSIALCS